MGRYAKINADAFLHKCHHGNRMRFLESRYGNDGYAIWFKILETLTHNDYHYINLSSQLKLDLFADFCIPVFYKDFYKEKFKDQTELFLSVVHEMVRLEIIDEQLWQHRIIWSQELVDSLSHIYQKRENSTPTISQIRDLLSISDTEINISTPNNGINGVKKTTRKKERKKDIKERKADFVKILNEYVPTYGKEMVRDFYEYWSEHSSNGYKMRFEKEKVFDVARRLKTWHKRNDSFPNKNKRQVSWG